MWKSRRTVSWWWSNSVWQDIFLMCLQSLLCNEGFVTQELRSSGHRPVMWNKFGGGRSTGLRWSRTEWGWEAYGSTGSESHLVKLHTIKHFAQVKYDEYFPENFLKSHLTVFLLSQKQATSLLFFWQKEKCPSISGYTDKAMCLSKMILSSVEKKWELLLGPPYVWHTFSY